MIIISSSLNFYGCLSIMKLLPTCHSALISLAYNQPHYTNTFFAHAWLRFIIHKSEMWCRQMTTSKNIFFRLAYITPILLSADILLTYLHTNCNAKEFQFNSLILLMSVRSYSSDQSDYIYFPLEQQGDMI